MGHDDDTPSPCLPVLGQQADHLVAGRLVEGGRRLIGEDHRRAVNEGPRDRDPLPFTDRQLVRPFLKLVAESHSPQQFLGVGGRVVIASQGAHGDIFNGAQVVDQEVLLKDKAKVLPA